MNYYTDTFNLMQAIKYNLRQYGSSEKSSSLSKMKSWSVGFVFAETVFPAITVFPIMKKFKGKRANGYQYVEYHYSIDIYSSRHAKLLDSKEFCLQVADDVKNCLNGSLHMVDDTGKSHCVDTKILASSEAELTSSKERGFQSSLTITIMCLAYHQMNSERVDPSRVNETNFDEFLSKIYTLVKRDALSLKLNVKQWEVKIAKPLVRTPAVLILPGNESIEDQYAGNIDVLNRPVSFHVVSKGYPRKQFLRENMNLADQLVSVVEKYYAVEGYAQDCVIDSIDYHYNSSERGFEFKSTINATYFSRKTYTRIIR